MGVTGLKAAVDRGEPLVEVVVKFRTGIDPAAAVNRINANFQDIDLHPQPWYNQSQVRIGSATSDALGRLFGWQLKRVSLERYDKDTGTWDYWPNAYRWEEINKPDLGHSEIGGLIEEIGLSQPGAGDLGQWWG